MYRTHILVLYNRTVATRSLPPLTLSYNNTVQLYAARWPLRCHPLNTGYTYRQLNRERPSTTVVQLYSTCSCTARVVTSVVSFTDRPLPQQFRVTRPPGSGVVGIALGDVDF